MLRSMETSKLRGVGRLRPLPAPELSLDHPFVGLEVVPVGDHVLARQRSATTHILEVLEVDFAAADAR